MPQILFDWQDAYDQNISLSVACCNSESCDAATINTVADVINEDVITGSMVLGLDGHPRIVYVDRSTTSDPQSGPAYFSDCSDAYCSSSTATAIGTSSSGYGADVAIEPDGFAIAAFEGVSQDQFEYIRCTSADCSMRNQTSVSADFGYPYGRLSIGVGAHETGIAVVGASNLDYVACTDVSCSNYDLEVMPSQLAGALEGMVFNLDGLPHFIAYDLSADNIAHAFQDRA